MMAETTATKDYSDGRTKQAFKDSTDINKLLMRAQQGETISHLAKHGAIYGDFTDIDDLLTGMTRLERGNQIFAQLPGEVRCEFDQSPQKFFNFVNNPQNSERLEELLPALAAPGNQFRTMDPSIPPVTAEPEPTPPGPTPPAPPPSPPADPTPP